MSDPNVTQEPETVETMPASPAEAETPTEASTPSENDADAAGEGAEESPAAGAEEPFEAPDDEAPEGFHYIEVFEGENVANVGERLHMPVNYITDNNPDDANKETGLITASRLVVPDGY